MAQILWIYLYPCKLPGTVHHNWAVSISKPDMEISSFFDCSARSAVMWLGMALLWGSAPIARLRSSLGANSRPHYLKSVLVASPKKDLFRNVEHSMGLHYIYDRTIYVPASIFLFCKRL